MPTIAIRKGMDRHDSVLEADRDLIRRVCAIYQPTAHFRVEAALFSHRGPIRARRSQSWLDSLFGDYKANIPPTRANSVRISARRKGADFNRSSDPVTVAINSSRGICLSALITLALTQELPGEDLAQVYLAPTDADAATSSDAHKCDYGRDIAAAQDGGRVEQRVYTALPGSACRWHDEGARSCKPR